MERKIICHPTYYNTHFEAYREQWDEGDFIGIGKTKQEAINELKELENDYNSHH